MMKWTWMNHSEAAHFLISGICAERWRISLLTNPVSVRFLRFCAIKNATWILLWVSMAHPFLKFILLNLHNYLWIVSGWWDNVILCSSSESPQWRQRSRSAMRHVKDDICSENRLFHDVLAVQTHAKKKKRPEHRQERGGDWMPSPLGIVVASGPAVSVVFALLWVPVSASGGEASRKSLCCESRSVWLLCCCGHRL